MLNNAKSAITVLFLLSALLLSSCEKSDPDDHKFYIFLGHTYAWTIEGKTVDYRIEDLNYDIYDEIWLGGDICAATSREESTLDYLDDVFNISDSRTHWAVGNHDIGKGNLHYITEKTGRDLYYTHYENGITRLIINTNFEQEFYKDSCDFRARQLDFIHNVIDTVQKSTHLVLLMHNVVWEDVEYGMGAKEAANATAGWYKFLCEPQTWFRLSIYPKLQEIHNNGTQVILISGDGGQYSKKYYYKTTEGIECYISGINNSFDHGNASLVDRFNTNPDSILLFHHNIKDGTLKGKFFALDEF